MSEQIRQIDLYRAEFAPIAGAEACAKAVALAERGGGQPLYILAYTPDFCGFLTPKDVGLAADLFELHCFCDGFELRWIWDDGNGKAVILSEGPLGEEYSPVPLKGMYKRRSHYVLWGKEQGGRLFEHRVGELTLPDGVEVPPKGRIFLNFAEYFKEDPYGNLRWHSDRLTGFSSPTLESTARA